jgi:hypothetical protein
MAESHLKKFPFGGGQLAKKSMKGWIMQKIKGIH